VGFHTSIQGLKIQEIELVAKAPVVEAPPAITPQQIIQAAVNQQPPPVQPPPVQPQAAPPVQVPITQIPVAQAPQAQAAPQFRPPPVEQPRAAVAMADPLAIEQFFVAVKSGNLSVVKDMISRRMVDPSFTLEKGTTPLMHAAAYGHMSVVKYLVGQKANLNSQDPNGTTALMWAVYRGHKDVARFLIEKGSDPTLKRDDGDRAVDIARRWNRPDIIALFEPVQADQPKRGIASQPQPAKKRPSTSEPDYSKIRSIRSGRQ
jgi:hypothetical protein